MPNPNNSAPGAKGAAPKARHTVWDNPVFTMVLALVMGFATWVIVTVFVDPQGGVRTVTNVPINYTNGASTYTAQGLDIVEKPDIEGVTVKVEGNSTIIGNIQNSDIMVYPSYAGVSGAGKVSLRLQARVTNTTDFPGNIECTVENPETIDVVFDEVSEKTVPVTVDASAVSISSGYMLNKTAAVPAEITLRGPTSELDQVSSIVAPVQTDGELADTTTVPATLELRDAEGNVFTPQYTSMESDSANVTLTVYQVRELPLKVDFIGTPNGFDVESLHYSLSQQTLQVAGPARTISTLEALTVTDFDLAREFEPGRDYQRLIELPAGIVSLDGVTNVTLDFDTEDMGTTKLNVSNIRAINVPSNYELQILSSLVSNVTLYGPAEEIKELSADSIVAQIDCRSLNLTVGQQTIAVSIQIPSSSRIFATGSYTVQCEVTSK